MKDNVSDRMQRKRNQYLRGQLEQSSGSRRSQVNQAANLVKNFNEEEKAFVSKKAKIGAPEITAAHMVALKIDVGIAWEKLKKLSRYTNTYTIS